MREHLLAHTAPGPEGLLFPAKDDPTAHLRQSTLARVFYPARDAAGRPDLSFHDLRHTGAVLAAQTGAALTELMGRLGHSTSSAALRYEHAAAQNGREPPRRYDPNGKPVGREVVALFQRDAQTKGAERAILVTLGRFSEPARKASIAARRSEIASAGTA